MPYGVARPFASPGKSWSLHGLPAVSGSMHRFKSASRVGSFFLGRQTQLETLGGQAISGVFLGRPVQEQAVFGASQVKFAILVFFHARPTAPGQSHRVGGPISQVVVEFVWAPPNRSRMEAGYLCDALEAPLPPTHSLTCCQPAPLLLIQPAQQQLELPMIFPFRMFTRAASRATALGNRQCCAHRPPSPWSARQLTSNRRFHGIDPGRVLSKCGLPRRRDGVKSPRTRWKDALSPLK